MMALEKLKDLAIFKNCTETDITRFMMCVAPAEKHYSSNQLVEDTLDMRDRIYVVLSGTLGSYWLGTNGRMSLVAAVEAGDVYGQLNAFAETGSDPLILIAKTDSVCLVFPAHVFYQQCSSACTAHQKVIRNMMGLLAEQAMSLAKKVSYLSGSNLQAKVAFLLLNEADKAKTDGPFSLGYNREEMAELLAVARPSLSRTLSEMKEQGLIDYHRSTFRILNRASLEMMT